MLKTIDLALKSELVKPTDTQTVHWISLMIQRRITKVQNEIGAVVKHCRCKKCVAINLLISEMMTLGIALQVPSLEYEVVSRHSKTNPKGKFNV